jgi:hypothetical protein
MAPRFLENLWTLIADTPDNINRFVNLQSYFLKLKFLLKSVHISEIIHNFCFPLSWTSHPGSDFYF